MNTPPTTSNIEATLDESPVTPVTNANLPDPPLIIGGSQTNPDDLTRFRISQSFSTPTSKNILKVRVGRPSNASFFRARDEDFPALLLVSREEDETYLVESKLQSALVDEPTVSVRLLITTVTIQGILTLWPVRIPDENGRLDRWGRSALDAVEIAKTKWIRLISNRELGEYQIREAAIQAPEPQWPSESFREIVNIVFRDRVIRTLDHPALRRLRGEI